MTIRVLRVIEYQYQDTESYFKDKQRWLHSYRTEDGRISLSSAIVSECITNEGSNWIPLDTPE